MRRIPLIIFLVSNLLLNQNIALAWEIKHGTVVPVVLSKSISSARVQDGDSIDMRVEADIKDPITGETIIKADTPVSAIVTHAERSGRVGKKGTLGFEIHSTQSIDGTPIPLGADLARDGKSNRGSSITMGVIGAVVFLPLAFGLLQKGHEAYIKKGTKLTAFVQSDTSNKLPVVHESYEALQKIYDLYQKGVLSEGEYQTQKERLLKIQ